MNIPHPFDNHWYPLISHYYPIYIPLISINIPLISINIPVKFMDFALQDGQMCTRSQGIQDGLGADNLRLGIQWLRRSGGSYLTNMHHAYIYIYIYVYIYIYIHTRIYVSIIYVCIWLDILDRDNRKQDSLFWRTGWTQIETVRARSVFKLWQPLQHAVSQSHQLFECWTLADHTLTNLRNRRDYLHAFQAGDPIDCFKHVVPQLESRCSSSNMCAQSKAPLITKQRR